MIPSTIPKRDIRLFFYPLFSIQCFCGCIAFILLIMGQVAYGQEGFIINKIAIQGNKKTKAITIKRELDIQEGDTLALDNLSQRLERNRWFVINTRLFNEVVVSLVNKDTIRHTADLLLKVTESWYVYPMIEVGLVDRNFNVWWNEQNRSLRRLNMGFRLSHQNLTGKRDELRLRGQTGYSQKLELSYELPILDKQGRYGLEYQIYRKRQREIGFNTINNRVEFHRFDDDYLLEQFYSSFQINFRPRLFHTHALRIAHDDWITHPLVQDSLNPRYFLNDNSHQKYATISYRFISDKRDIRTYPTAGYLFDFTIQKDGLGIWKDLNSLFVQASLSHYYSIKYRWVLANRISIKKQLLGNTLPYNRVQALGYGPDFVRGYEYYVADGRDFILLKSSLRFKILNCPLYFGKLMPISWLRQVPLQIHVTLNNDFGRTNNNSYYLNRTNDLNNRWLWGIGIGIDVIAYYNTVGRIELSRNHLGEIGLFLDYDFKF